MFKFYMYTGMLIYHVQDTFQFWIDHVIVW